MKQSSMKHIYNFWVVLLLTTSTILGQVKTEGITKLTNIESSYPYWSPDGNMIAILNSDGSTGLIGIVNA